jgi:hypothetical protein
MFKTFGRIFGGGLAILVLVVIVVTVVVPIITDPDPTSAIDAFTTGTMNYIGSPPPQGGDPRIVTWIFIAILLYAIIFAIRKMMASTRGAFGSGSKADHGKDKH